MGKTKLFQAWRETLCSTNSIFKDQVPSITRMVIPSFLVKLLGLGKVNLSLAPSQLVQRSMFTPDRNTYEINNVGRRFAIYF